VLRAFDSTGACLSYLPVLRAALLKLLPNFDLDPGGAMRALIDADLFLEAVLSRGKASGYIENLWNMLQNQRVEGFLTETGLEKIYQHLSRFKNPSDARKVIRGIQSMVQVCSVTSRIANRAQRLPIEDYESAVEVACAIECDLNTLITQNPQNFRNTDLQLLSVDELFRQQLKRTLENSIFPASSLDNLFDTSSLKESIRANLTPVNLSQWFSGVFDSKWQVVKEILRWQQFSFSFRGAASSISRGKGLAEK
jgi:predicted nucleic acid-binding protein